MVKKAVLKLRSLFLTIPLVVMAMDLCALDFPHAPSNPTLSISCLSCHDLHGSLGTLLMPAAANPDMDGDDTEANNLCWSCHVVSSTPAPYKVPHSSDQISIQHGTWNVECKDCHDPHSQPQFAYGGASYLATGTLTAVVSGGTSTLTDTGKSWTVDEHAGRVVFPDVNARDRRGRPIGDLSYRVLSNTADTLTVDGAVDTSYIAAGDTYGIIYGKLIRNQIKVPSTTTWKQVKFFSNTGSNSFADDDATLDGVCQVCHTKTGHFKNDGTGADQMHTNADRGDITGTAGENCTEKCHLHLGGFGHGKGNTDVTLCIECHGHEEGTIYDPDGTFPYFPNGSTLTSRGFGSVIPHTTHTESWHTDGANWETTKPAGAGDDDLRGPGIYCSWCHDTANMPNFRIDGAFAADDVNSDGVVSLDETSVCNDCHSPGGDYNGVNSEDGSVGAKDNWHSEGIYDADYNFKPGKEKWCAGCHDKVPSHIVIPERGIDITAPKVIGDEEEEFRYGKGWGFYKTGHGTPSSTTLPATGGIKAGPDKSCTYCHQSIKTHIDGDHRTFDCSDGCDSDEYGTGYRMRFFAGSAPMEIPRGGTGTPKTTDFRLCLRSGCHGDVTTAFTDPNATNTNFREEIPPNPAVNLHYVHLNRNGNYMSGDWSGNWNTRITCIGCHNPHGTKNHSMIRTGELSGNAPIRIWFYNSSLGDLPWNMTSPNPDNVTLGASDRSILKSDSVNDYCYGHCHGAAWRHVVRDPFQVTDKTPLLNWAGVTGFEQDGVTPDAAAAGTAFKFMVQYQDYENELPDSIYVWVDVNDNGSYEDPAEKYALAPESVNPVPVSGASYGTTVTLNKAGDNLIKYTFTAADLDGAATGVATGDSTLQIQNTVPTLDWTAESESYTSDGVHSDNGANGGTYQFRIKYSDLDGDTCPVSASANIQVWIDANDNGYEAGEKFNMTEVDGGDTDCTDGKLYYYDAVLSVAGSHNYRFYASDGSDAAAGAPVTTDSTVTVAADGNTVPVLAWYSESCLIDGAQPPRGAATSTFKFKVKYTDEDNQCATGGGAGDIQVWIDENKDSTYDAGEKHNLSPVDGDADCTTAGGGKLYHTSPDLSLAINQDIPFEFHATDSVVPDNAIGEPVATGGLVDVYNALTVKFAGGGDYNGVTGIQDAVTANAGATTYMIYEGTYNNASLSTDDDNAVLLSACGADLTIIDANPDTSDGIALSSTSNVTVDGFSITGSDEGIYINTGDITLRDSKIYGNSGIGIQLSNANGYLTLVDGSEIYNNQASGIYFNGAANVSTITNTIIRNNTAAINGGGIFSQNVGAANATVLTNVTIKDNSAGSHGAGIYSNTGAMTISDSTIIGNIAAGYGGAWNITNTGSPSSISNTIIADNTAGLGGGAINNNGSTLTFNNSTLVGNVANGGHGGFIANTNGTIDISNSILWNNQITSNTYRGHVIYSNGGAASIADSIIQNDGDGDFSDAPFLYSGNIVFAVSGYASGNDPAFVDAASGDYSIKYYSDAVDNAGAGATATDRDGNTRTDPDIGAYEFMGEGVGGGVPTLAWTGETDFAADGVNPDSAVGGSNFEFRVDYTDAEGNAPSPIELWIDEDGDTLFDASEKYVMSAVGGGGQYGDSDYTNGERYTKTLSLVNPGGGTLSYRIVASDGIQQASGLPADINTVEVTNRIPTVAWPGDTNYESDGVNPDLADSGDTFTFRVMYTDADNTAPVIAQAWIDENDSSFYDSGEYYDMAAESGAGQYRDGDYSNGEYFTLDRAIAKAGDGRLNYRFAFSDGVDDATGDPASQQLAKERYSRYFTVNDFKTTVVSADASAASDTSIGVVMAYTGDENADNSLKVEYGVTPADTNGWTTTSTVGHPTSPYSPSSISGLTSGVSYDVKMTFTDADGVLGSAVTIDTFVLPIYATTAGTATAVVADESSITFSMPYTNDGNGNNTYTVDYKLSSEPTVWTNWVTDAAHAASPYSDTITGLTYSESYDIRMTYTDADGGGETQTVSNVTLPVVLTVCPSGCDYTSIQDAIDAAATDATVLVNVSGSPYSENIVFDVLDDGVTVKADGGAVTIQGVDTSTNQAVVTFGNSVTPAPVLDGFTIDNQTHNNYASAGILIEGGANPTIKNCVIEDNLVLTTHASSKAGGIIITQGGATIENCLIGSTTPGGGNQGRYGGGIYATTTAGGPYNLSITNSTIKYNTANLGGGGVYFTSYNGTINLTDSVVDNNTAASKGGGVYLVGAGATVTLSNSSVSNNSATSAGGAGIYSESALIVSDTNIDSNVTAAGKGGGIYMSGANAALTMTGGTVSNHSGLATGGGIYSANSTAAEPLTITNTTITANTVTGGGGGIYLGTLSNPSIFTNVTVSNNSAGGWTGGLQSTGAPLTLSNSTITANSAVQWSGGLYINAATANVVDDSIISSNYARGGGGAYVTGGGTLNVTDSTIASNTTSSSSGGGISNDASTVNLTRSYLKGNFAAANGGGLSNGGTTTLTSTIVSGNVGGVHTYDLGGGIATSAGVVLNLYSSTIAGNYVTRGGGGLYAPAGSLVTIENTIIYGNDAGQYLPDLYSSLTSAEVTYSDIGGWTGGGATNPTPVDPIYISVDQASASTPTTGGDYRLQNSSTLIDIGGGSNVPAYDIENEYRPYDGDADTTATPDIGADEMTTGNQAPTLDWLGSGNYATDGVDPDSAVSGSSFTFKVEYTDLDNHPPNAIYVWVDADDSGTFEDPAERTALTVAVGEDGNYANGEIYETSPALTLTTVGNLDYYFEATDGWFAATGSPASTRTVQVTNSVPDTPTNSTPADVATNVALSPTLTGSAFNDSDPGSSHLHSQWQVATDAGFASVVYDSGAVTDLTSHTIGFTLDPSTVYYWRVRYRDNLSAWSAAYSTGTSFTTTTIPNTPTNSTPADVATGVSPTPTLTGSAFSDPNGDSHQASRWQVDDNADFSSITYDSGSVGDLVSHTVGSALSEGAVYYWRVSYQDNKGAWSSYSSGTSFTTNQMPNTPSNSTPADAAPGVSSTPTLTASAFGDPDGGDTHAASQWQVDDNADFSSITYDSGSVGDLTSHTLGSPLAGVTTYYWRVRYQDNNGGWSAYSTSTSFTTAANPPNTPTNATPVDTATGVEVTPTLTASAFDDPDPGDTHAASQWQVDDNADFSSVTYDSGEVADLESRIVELPLTGSTTYYWRVRYKDNNGAWSSYSTGTSFTTEAAPAYVCGDGNLQPAIAAATSGDKIIVCAGSYAEKVDFLGKNITLKSIKGAGETTITGNNTNAAAVNFTNSETTSAVLDGFTIDNVYHSGSASRGIYIVGSAPTIQNSIIEGTLTAATVDGGGIYINGGGASISDTVIRNNTTRSGGGMYVAGAVNLSISNSTISSNSGATNGGGMFLTGGISGTVDISDTTISSNTILANGAGIYLYTANALTFSLTDTTIDNNSQTNTASYDGGGIYMRASNASQNVTATITNGSISNNISRNGGAIRLWDGIGLTVDGTTFNGNEADSSGGALFASGSFGSLDMSNCTIAGNDADVYGGGMYTNLATVTITNCMITGNHAYDPAVSNSDGGGIFYDNTAAGTLYLYNSTVSGNYALRYGGGVRLWRGSVVIGNSIVWGNTVTGSATHDVLGAAATASYSNIGPSTNTYAGSNGNIDANPIMVDMQQASQGSPTPLGDFRLCAGLADPVGCASPAVSPSIDTGTYDAGWTPAVDFEGVPRPFDVDGIDDGVNDYDMGASEYMGSNQVPTLDWIGSGNYISDGVDPDSAAPGSTFTFKVEYTDLDDHAPSAVYVWVDADDSGTFEDPGERTTLSLAAGGDGDYTNGEIYETSPGLTLNTIGDIDYYFEASDGWSAATGAPASIQTVTVTNTLPDTPTNSTPADTATNIALSPTLTGSAFNDSDAGDTHANSQWQVDDNSDFSSVTYDSGSVTDLESHAVGTPLSATTTYYWRVRYQDNNSGWSSYSSGTSFTSSNAPDTPVNGNYKSSETDVSVTPTLNGSAFNDADAGDTHANSQWLVDDNADCATPVYDSGAVTDKESHIVGSALSNSTTYYWCVRYQDSKGDWSSYSSPGTGFTTAAPNNAPDTPTNSNLISGETDISTTPTLNGSSFNDGDAGDTHANSQWLVDDNADCATPVYDSGTVTDLESHAVGSALDGSTTYYWCVRYQDNHDAWSSYSSPGSGFTTVAAGATYTVCKATHADHPCDYQSINAGIDDAGVVNGDTLLVSDDTYSENVNFDGKDITIKSTSGAASTTIQGLAAYNTNPVVTFSSGETSGAVLDGFTLNNQQTTASSRGIYVSGGSAPTIKNSIVEGNTASNGTNGGGGVYVDNSVPTFDGVTIRANTADNRNGCGMYITGAASGATILNSTIGGTTAADKNTCGTNSGKGGGIYYTGASTGTLSITGSNIQYNHAQNYGAGIYITGVSTTTTLTNTTILNNDLSTTATSYGGGIWTDSPVTMSGGEIASNNSSNNYAGGGIYFTSTDVIIKDGAKINSNIAGSNGGGGIYMAGTAPTLTMTDCYVQGNETTPAGGDGDGAGINIAAGTATITNCIISGNSTNNAYWSAGGGIHVTAGHLNLYHSTVAGNWANRHGGGVFVQSGATATINGSLMWDNVAADANTHDIEDEGTATVDYSAYESGTGFTGGNNVTSVTGTVFTTPAVAGDGSPTTAGDFHIKSDAVELVDAGDAGSSVTDDIDGDDRTGSTNDIGADEYVNLSQNATLHPSGVAQYDTAANIDDAGTFTITGGTWTDAFDSNDGDTSRSDKCCDGGPNNPDTEWMAVNIDNLSDLTGPQDPGANPTIVSLKFYARLRYRPSGGPEPGTNVAQGFKLGYTTDDTTPPAGTVPNIDSEPTTASGGSAYELFSSSTYTAGLTLADIDNLLVWVRYDKTVNNKLRVTEIYAEVEYIPGD